MDFTENINMELKETFTDDIKKEAIAFANTHGGIIYIGIADDGNIVGVKMPNDVLLQVTNAFRDSIKPDITMFTDCMIEEIEGKQVIKISVQRGVSRPYYLSDKGLRPSGVYVRQGSSSVPASEDAIRQMIKETDGDTYEKARSLDQELTFKYTIDEMAKRGMAFGEVQQKTLGIIGDDGLYTNLGLLLSDQCVHSIKAAYFQGTEKSIFMDRKEFCGSLLEQLASAYQYIDLLNKTKAMFLGLNRVDKRDYPPEAIREALLNAIVHRDYSFSGSTLINIYEDRMELVSLGGLVSGLSLDAVMLGVSQSRNERLANLFYRLRLIEAYGTGIGKMISSYRDAGLMPAIKAADGAFQVVLPNINYNHEAYEMHETASDNNKYAIPKKSELKQQYKKVMEFIESNGSIARKDVQDLLNVGQTRALAILNEMADAGYIKTIGSGKKTKYHLEQKR
ncbi:RNA-binding domain-containing protein [Lutispora sp.]|uniref:RNA-binding domain-containing protein n=1 Tax=Lutispora sp. TaxID=2828727 RepID=UPI002B215E96|nr:RNA-binding domain-containing protein [Lutispora sp.]MEA4960962.1 putative DNA binding domain-containing protein [Lutispora sp.]